jgi:formate dehydrogenase subunit delta
MANQIAQFFEPYPEEEAVAGVADHLQRFWEPGMRAELLAIPEPQQPELHPLVRRAMERLRMEPVR